ncbi:MAG: lactate dehydrogenase [Anaerovoracaceae bacterium]
MTDKRSIWELAPEASKLRLAEPLRHSGLRVNLLALGDVGATLLMGLKVLGGGLIERIGIYDVNRDVMSRYEMEMNQIGWPFGEKNLPEVVCLDEEDLFDCDMFVFCASKAVPPVGASGDVRMMQLEANSKIVSHYGRMAGEKNFKGIFAVVSDPVDPLCKAALMASGEASGAGDAGTADGSGLKPGQVRGYGLGVMNKRAEYYARGDRRFESYLTEGRAFGPHGGDLVIANSIENYDDEISRELTALTVEANLKVRELGFKPYIAPALSSGAISLLLTLRGEWNYSSVYLGNGAEGAFLGIKNRIDPVSGEIIIEDLPLPQKLYDRIETAYRNLCEIN